MKYPLPLNKEIPVVHALNPAPAARQGGWVAANRWIHIATVQRGDKVNRVSTLVQTPAPLLHRCLRAGGDALDVGFG
jgi:hypothetical protein